MLCIFNEVLITMPLFLVFSHQIAALFLTLFFMVLRQFWFWKYSNNFICYSHSAIAIARTVKILLETAYIQDQLMLEIRAVNT